MIDFNKPVQTRDGRKVEIKATDLSGEYPILGVVVDETGRRDFETWTSSGCRFTYSASGNDADLINVPERVERWANLYTNDLGGLHATRDSADDRATNSRAAVIRITYEDGKPVAVALEDCK